VREHEVYRLARPGALLGQVTKRDTIGNRWGALPAEVTASPTP
jgi:hypothetical protein